MKLRGSSWVSVVLAVGETRPHIESAAVKEDADTRGGEGAEAAGGVLDGLDFAVESFSHGVVDGMGEVGEQSAQVVFACVGEAFDRMEFATAGTGIPLIEKRATLVPIILMPKPTEVFLAQPSTGDLPIALRQTFEVHRMFFR